MLGWTGDIGAKKVWEIPRQPKKWKKKCLQYIVFSDGPHLFQYWGNSIVSPTDLVPLGILQSTRKKKMTPHRLVDFTKKNIQSLTDYALRFIIEPSSSSSSKFRWRTHWPRFIPGRKLNWREPCPPIKITQNIEKEKMRRAWGWIWIG